MLLINLTIKYVLHYIIQGGDVVCKVVCGGSHSGVLTARARACYMWGLNRNGQTGTNIKVRNQKRDWRERYQLKLTFFSVLLLSGCVLRDLVFRARKGV
jgi:alpha-tubulin suppressor-like RCC1 family protein